MPAKLKVFATRIGFHDTVVAVPSQKAALAAWDVRDNLFAQGAAGLTDDPAAIEAALAKPGVVLRRAAGSHDPFSETPGAPAVPKIDRPKTKAPPPGGSKKEAPPPPDRSALTAAEKALASFEAEAEAEMQALDEARRELDARELDLRRSHDARRRDLERDRERAARIYERAGGR